jgi:ATP-dependent Clp protease adaptor protein ClpS
MAVADLMKTLFCLLMMISALLCTSVFSFSPTSMRQSSRATQSCTTGSSSSLWGVPSAMAGGPAVLDRPTVIERPTVVERPETERVVDKRAAKERKGMGHEAWEVRIYNDGLNTREHVARSLVQITGQTEMEAYQTMMQAHQNGIAVVGRWVYEVAEMYAEGLKKNGIVADMVPVEEDK